MFTHPQNKKFTYTKSSCHIVNLVFTPTRLIRNLQNHTGKTNAVQKLLEDDRVYAEEFRNFRLQL